MINPQLVDEQVRGGVVQGIGAALFEHCLYDERGQLLNGNMADYLVPMAMEMPDIEVGHVVTPTADSELGAKGAGEAGTAGAPGCVMNAINDALRPLGAAPLTDMPFTPDKILRALGKVVTLPHFTCQIAGALVFLSMDECDCGALQSRAGQSGGAQPPTEGRTCHGHQGRQEGDRGGLQEALELGPLGQGRPDRHAQSRHARGHRQAPPSLIKTGKVFALGIPLDRDGPQTGLFGGRFNPIHQMLATGTDAIAGQQDWNKIRYADDTLMLCVQGATHWDALGHIFYEDKAYNGHDAKLIDSSGPQRARHRALQEQDGRPRRAARHRALTAR